MNLVRIAKCSSDKAFEIKSILELNCITSFTLQKKTSKTSKVVIEVERKHYIQAKIITDKFLRNEELSKFEPIFSISRLKKIHHLINTQSTESPTLFAQKLELSMRQLNIYLKHLKNLNAEISYNREKKSFCYKKPFNLIFQFSLLSITNDKIVEMNCSSEEETKIDFKNISDYMF